MHVLTCLPTLIIFFRNWFTILTFSCHFHDCSRNQIFSACKKMSAVLIWASCTYISASINVFFSYISLLSFSFTTCILFLESHTRFYLSLQFVHLFCPKGTFFFVVFVCFNTLCIILFSLIWVTMQQTTFSTCKKNCFSVCSMWCWSLMKAILATSETEWRCFEYPF